MDVRDVQENGNNTKHTHLFFPRRNDCWAGDNGKTTVHLGQVGLSARGGNRIKNLTAVAASPSLGFTTLGNRRPLLHLGTLPNIVEWFQGSEIVPRIPRGRSSDGGFVGFLGGNLDAAEVGHDYRRSVLKKGAEESGGGLVLVGQ